jgi:opacity protein-like surface antigen
METSMNSKYRWIIALAAWMAMSSPAWAQSSSRGPGWEYGIDAVYLDSADWSFDGGSSVSVDSDLALTLTFGYCFNSRVELQFALDWQSSSYDATLQSSTLPISIDVSGDYEAFTPRINVNYNFLDSDLTPYVTAGIGWSFIDTNIPNSQVQIGCWWDPWYGQICVPVQDTRSADTFTYQLGVGVRWDAPRGFSMRLGYEKHWYEFDNSSSSPDFDQYKLGVIFRY